MREQKKKPREIFFKSLQDGWREPEAVAPSSFGKITFWIEVGLDVSHLHINQTFGVYIFLHDHVHMAEQALFMFHIHTVSNV